MSYSPSEQETVSSIATNTLLAAYEPEPYKKVQYNTKSPVILCCDHASNRIPESLGNLGLTDDQLQEHIAWDIGAAELTLNLAQRLSCTALLNNYSRLVVDCNRYLSDPSAFVQKSDQVIVPGNVDLNELEKAARAEAIYYRYHRAIRQELEPRITQAQAPILISIHSFTKQLREQEERDIDIGVLWDKDPRIPIPLLKALRLEKGLVVGDNQPYSGKDMADYTVDHHAEAKGLAYVSLEIRNDLISHSSGLEEWTDRLASIFLDMFEDKSIFRTVL